MELYKIKPLKWKKRNVEGWIIWTATAAANNYEVEKFGSKWRLLVNGSWRDFPLVGTPSQAKQVAENDYIEITKKNLEPIEANPVEIKPVKVRLTAVVKSAEEITGIYEATAFSVDTKHNIESIFYTPEMNDIAGTRIKVTKNYAGIYDYSSENCHWKRNWLKDFREK